MKRNEYYEVDLTGDASLLGSAVAPDNSYDDLFLSGDGKLRFHKMRDHGSESTEDSLVVEDGVESEQDDGVISNKEALKRYAKTAGLFSFNRFVSVASEFTAVYFLSRLGDKHLAASGLITVANNFILTSSVVSNYATGYFQGQLLNGNKNTSSADVGRMLMTSYMFATALSVIDSVLLSFSGNAFTLLGQDPEISAIVNDYFRALAMTGGVAFTLLSVSSQQTAYALKHRGAVFGINLARRAIYLGFAYAMIFGALGFPELGVAGLAYARSIAAAVDQIFFTFYYKFHPKLKQYEFFKNHIKESLSALPAFLNKAGLMGAQTFNEFLAAFIGVNFAGWTGENELSAAEIATQYNALMKIPLLSATQSATIEMKKLKNPESRKRLGNLALLTSLAVPVIAIPVLCAASEQLVGLFLRAENDTTREIIVKAGSQLLFITAAMQIPEAIRNLSAGALRGNGRFLSPLFISLLSISLVGVPLSYALAIPANLKSLGVFLSMLIASSAGAAMIFPYWLRSSIKDTHVVVDDTSSLIQSIDSASSGECLSSDESLYGDAKAKRKCCVNPLSFFSSRSQDGEEKMEAANHSCVIL